MDFHQAAEMLEDFRPWNYLCAKFKSLSKKYLEATAIKKRSVNICYKIKNYFVHLKINRSCFVN